MMAIACKRKQSASLYLTGERALLKVVELVISCVALVLIRESVCDAAEIGVAAATTAVSALGSLVFVLFYSISCSWMFTDTQWFIVVR
ncbi:hypothetical protein Q1695_008733 [Nippostrongylus brasiliensis]|nr:hypothetical protein Q1695_008733 [Nippostrongylus brasiliensis]